MNRVFSKSDSTYSVSDDYAARLELEKLRSRVTELETRLGERKGPQGLNFYVSLWDYSEACMFSDCLGADHIFFIDIIKKLFFGTLCKIMFSVSPVLTTPTYPTPPQVDHFFALGSPLAVFLMMREHEHLIRRSHMSAESLLPSCVCNRIHNVHHPSDPVVRVGVCEECVRWG